MRISAPIDPQYSPERVRFAIEKWLYGVIYEHRFQLFIAAYGARFWGSHTQFIVGPSSESL